MESFRASLLKVPAYKVWLDFATDLNRLGYELLRDREVPCEDRQRLAIAVLFVRAHKSLQASLLLAELGLLSDARVVLRSAAERRDSAQRACE